MCAISGEVASHGNGDAPALCFSDLPLPHPLVKQMIAQYAKHMRKDGFFLGLGDLALFACQEKVGVLTHHWVDRNWGEPGPLSLNQRLQSFTGEENEFVPGPLDASPWVVSFTSCTFARGSFFSLNHAMPLLHKDDIGDGWEKMTSDTISKMQAKLKKLQMKLDAWSADSDGDEAHESLTMRFQQLEQKVFFYQTLITQGYFPVDVPGDGNCLLWSMACLKKGPGCLKIEPSEKEVKEMRKARGCQMASKGSEDNSL